MRFVLFASLISFLLGCSPGNVAMRMLIASSEVNRFLELPPVNQSNQNSVQIKGQCRDSSAKVRIELKDSASTPQSLVVEAPCLEAQFETTVDLELFQDGVILAHLLSEKGFETNSESFKDTVMPALSLMAAATVNVHKDLEVTHTLEVSESDVEVDSSKIRLTGDSVGCKLEVEKNIFASSSWYLKIKDCSGNGQIQVQLDAGLVKDRGGNLTSAQADLAPVNIYNRRLQLAWSAVSPQFLRSSGTASFPFRITHFDPTAGMPTWPGLSAYLEFNGDRTGCSFNESGSFPDRVLIVTGCTAASSALKFRLRKDSFANPAGLLNLDSDWSSFLNIDNIAPTLTLTNPAVTAGGAGNTFVWTAQFVGADSILLNNSFVTLTEDTDNCAVSINGTGDTRSISVSGCSVSSGTVNLNILPGAAVDLAGNTSAGASGGSLSIVNVGPTLSIGSPNYSAVNSSRVLEFPLTYTNATSISLSVGDVSMITTGNISGCQAGILGSGLTSRILRLQNCSGDGTLKISIAAGTAFNSGSALSTPAAGPSPIVIVDNTAPAFTLSSSGGALKIAPFTVNMSFTENLVGITNAFTTTDGSISNFSSTATSVDFTISPTFTVGNLILNLPTGIFTDAAGNSIPALSEVFNIGLPPQINLVTSDSRVTYSGLFQIDVISDQDITPPMAGSFQITGATPGVIVGALRRYTMFVTPSGASSISIKMNQGAVTATATGIASNASNILNLSYVAPVTVSFANTYYDFDEGDAPSVQNLRINVTPTPVVDVDLNLNVDSGQSTAVSGSDYNISSLNVVIPAGSTFIDVPVNVMGNTLVGTGHPVLILGMASSQSFVRFGVATVKVNLIDDEVVQTFASISSGVSHTCGVTTDGALKCWGSNSFGQLGDGTTTDKSLPTLIDSGISYQQISLGSSHTCGVTTAGILKCWGSNVFGQVGNGTTIQQISPVVIDAGVNYSKISLGSITSCAITVSNILKCWGSNSSRQFGNNSSSGSSSPMVITSGVSYKDISMGNGHSCRIAIDDTLSCWGRNDTGQVGNGTTVLQLNPMVIDPGVGYQSISMDTYHTCGVTTAGALKCWGANGSGQLGDGTTVNKSTPIIIDSGVSYQSVSLGGSHTCGITTTGALKCWGTNGSGQLGDGTTVNKSMPTIIDLSVSYQSVSLGDSHTCGITTSGQLKCWGSNSYGQLGDGTTVGKSMPTIIDSSVSYQSVSLGSAHTCGITTSGQLKCWGNNSSRQLGLYINPQSPLPIPIR